MCKVVIWAAQKLPVCPPSDQAAALYHMLSLHSDQHLLSLVLYLSLDLKHLLVLSNSVNRSPFCMAQNLSKWKQQCWLCVCVDVHMYACACVLHLALGQFSFSLYWLVAHGALMQFLSQNLRSSTISCQHLLQHRLSVFSCCCFWKQKHF